MGKTISVAADRKYDATRTVLPTEVARGVYIENPPSAEALKLMHLLIATAGGRMAEDVRHELRLASIKSITGMRNHSRATLRKLFIELAGAVMVFDDTDAKCEIIGGFLDRAKLDYRDEADDLLLVAWWFGGAFREMAEKSNHWAILDRQTIFHLNSKYSILLFQHIASLTGLDHVQSKSFTVSDLRALLGVTEGKLDRLSNLMQRALAPAIAEINHLSRMTLTATPKKIGRTVASIEIAWEVKPDPTAAKKEMAGSKVGRKARIAGTAETPALAFPAHGSLKGTAPWDELARANVRRIQGGHIPDLLGLSTAFRAWCGSRGIPLDKFGIDKTFVGFCASYNVG